MANIKSRSSASRRSASATNRNTADAWANIMVELADGSLAKVVGASLSLENFKQEQIIEAIKAGKSPKFHVEINLVDKESDFQLAL